MGIRSIRYCDISGVDDGVEAHELNVDQMRVEVDLAEPEYRKLLELLAPYIDAGRIEASAPEGSAPTRRGSRGRARGSDALSAEERAQLKQWAEEKGISVPQNNRFKRSIVEQWRTDTGEPGSLKPEPDADAARSPSPPGVART